jgi:hypothetical protein
MIRNESFKGMFFLPENIANEVAGELHYNHEGTIKLELFGSLFVTIGDIRDKTHSNTIWGYTFDGDNITLFDCNIIHTKYNEDFSTTVNITVVYNAKLILHGIHSHNIEDKIYNELYVRLDFLTDWIGAPYAKIEHVDGKTVITQNQPNNINFDITEDITGEIVFFPNMPFNNTLELRMDCYLLLNSLNNASFLEYRAALQKVQSMLSMFTLNKVRYTSLSLRSPNEFTKHRGELIIPRDIKILYLQEYIKSNEVNAYYFLLVYSDIENVFEKVVNKWFKINDELSPILNILYNHLGEYADFNESHFLSMVQAVEAFHRRKLQDTTRLKELDKARKLDILNEVSSEDNKQWLKGRLSFSYEPSLKERLKESFKLHASTLFKGDNWSNEADRDILIKHIVNTRNYYTHYGNELVHKKLKLNSMFSVTLLLRTLLIIQVLNEISIPVEVIEKAIKPNMRFKLPSTEEI